MSPTRTDGVITISEELNPVIADPCSGEEIHEVSGLLKMDIIYQGEKREEEGEEGG